MHLGAGQFSVSRKYEEVGCESLVSRCERTAHRVQVGVRVRVRVSPNPNPKALALALTLTHRVHVGRPQVALECDLGRLREMNRGGTAQRRYTEDLVPTGCA